MFNSRESIFYITVVVLVLILNFVWVDKKYDLGPDEEVPKEYKIQYVKIAGKMIKVELAQTAEVRAQGLSGRESLAEDTGLLFIFDESAEHAFWMKDMKFAIDIIWLSENGKIVYIKKNALPESYPSVFKPESSARYVLEVPAGFSEKNNLKEGDGTEFVP